MFYLYFIKSYNRHSASHSILNNYLLKYDLKYTLILIDNAFECNVLVNLWHLPLCQKTASLTPPPPPKFNALNF